MPATTLDQAIQARKMMQSGEAHRLRTAARVPLTVLAEELGVTPGAIGHWEHNRRCPPAPQLVRYLKALNKIRDLAPAGSAT